MLREIALHLAEQLRLSFVVLPDIGIQKQFILASKSIGNHCLYIILHRHHRP